MEIKSHEIIQHLKSKNKKIVNYQNTSYYSFCDIDNIESNSIIWIKDFKTINMKKVNKKHDLLIICNDLPKKITSTHIYIIVPNPRDVFFSVLNKYYIRLKKLLPKRAGDNSKVLSKIIGENVVVGNNCIIESNVNIGNNVIIEDNVLLYGDIIIEDSVNIGSGTIIGREGYGFFTDLDGDLKHIPHIGSVHIKSNAYIGANTVIDRGTLGKTLIGHDTKVNNLCHIGHNVKIFDHVFVGVGTIISGSTILENNVYVAPNSTIRNKIIIGHNSFIGMGSVVTKSVPENSTVMGNPAKEMHEERNFRNKLDMIIKYIDGQKFNDSK